MDDLINTLDTSGEYDALAKLREREPYFVLIGRDGLAPDLICDWADRNRRRALEDADTAKIDAARLERELRKSTQAELLAAQMRAYKSGYMPDPETAKPESYTGYVSSEKQKLADEKQAQQAIARRALNNAVGELTDFLTLFPDVPPEFQCLRETVKAMDSASDLLEPKRPGIPCA